MRHAIVSYTLHFILTVTVAWWGAKVAQAVVSVPPSSSPPPMVVSGSSATQILGFKEWKQRRVEDARAALEKAAGEAGAGRGLTPETRPDGAQTGANSVASGPRLGRIQKRGHGESRLEQAKLNHEIAEELSVKDYFLLYLCQLGNEQDFLSAIKKLSSEEVAEIMTAYKQQLDGGRTAAAPSPKLIRMSSPPMVTGARSGHRH